MLQMCWTVAGDDDFRQVLDEVCMNLNEVAALGAAIEVTFYDTDYDDEEENESDCEEGILVGHLRLLSSNWNCQVCRITKGTRKSCAE